MMKHEPSFALEIVNDGLGLLAMRTRVFLSPRGIKWWWHLNVGDLCGRYETIFYILCILDSLLDILVKGLKVVELLLNVFPFYKWIGLSVDPITRLVDGLWNWFLECSLYEGLRGVEKVRALGANGVIKGSTIGAVWFEVSGGIVSAKVVLMVVLGFSYEFHWKIGQCSQFWLIFLEDFELKNKHLMPWVFESTRVIRKRCLQVVEEALEQALSLFEFRGFSPFNGRKVVHVVKWDQECSYPRDHFPLLGLEERDHDMVHKLEIIGQGEWLFGLDILKNPSEKHGIRESHFATLSRTYHSMSDYSMQDDSVCNGLRQLSMLAQDGIRVIFVTGEAYGIFTNDGVPPLEFIS
ncbi:hypothetical protein Tco_1044071 [Tanacetum coccineum]|uniref:Uncharacterized protein n=1 Tax=Tanacetum coccineum TaxID=301880 RepID=A0ABQ5GNY6_9ASTR